MLNPERGDALDGTVAAQDAETFKKTAKFYTQNEAGGPTDNSIEEDICNVMGMMNWSRERAAQGLIDADWNMDRFLAMNITDQ